MLASGSVAAYARLASKYSVTAIAVPTVRARGRLRPGLRTSPPVNVTLAHPVCANIGPTIARPSSNTSADPPTTSRSGLAFCGFHPLAVGDHHDHDSNAPSRFKPAVM